jgi:hypothetical protein
MSKRIRGRLVTDVTYHDEHGTHRTGLVGYHISVHFFGLHEGGWAVGTGTTGPLGFYEFDFKRRTPGEGWLEIEARDRTGRLLPFLTGDGGKVTRWLVADDPVETLPMLDLVIPDKGGTGLQVTLGTGQAGGYSTGNQVRLLVDNEQFSRTAELVKASRHRVLMTQLYFQVPEEFKNVAMEESPKLVFDFHHPDLDQPRTLEPSDDRLERLIHAAALRGVPTRILLHSIHRPWFRKLLLAMLVYPIRGSDGVRWAFTGLGGKVATLDDVREYFDVAQAALEVQVWGFGHDPAFDNGAMHAKLLQVDNYSICFGAPFGPSCTDTTEHLIDAWVRGADTGLPKHSVGSRRSARCSRTGTRTSSSCGRPPMATRCRRIQSRMRVGRYRPHLHQHRTRTWMLCATSRSSAPWRPTCSPATSMARRASSRRTCVRQRGRGLHLSGEPVLHQ